RPPGLLARQEPRRAQPRRAPERDLDGRDAVAQRLDEPDLLGGDPRAARQRRHHAPGREEAGRAAADVDLEAFEARVHPVASALSLAPAFSDAPALSVPPSLAPGPSLVASAILPTTLYWPGPPR